MNRLSETGLIQLIRSQLPASARPIRKGIGDDAAVFAPSAGAEIVVTTDMLVEGVHFDLAYFEAEEIGHKALAVNLSDIAAMGAEPLYALTSLALPDSTPDDFVAALYRGLGELARRHRVDVIGGNLSRSPGPLVIDVTLLGESRSGFLSRDGARPGDLVAVTGVLGKASAGLAALRTHGRKALTLYPELAAAQLCPVPRLEEGRKLLGRATAGMDISDGLASDLHHLARESGVGIRLEEASLPLAPGVTLENALNGGEDYELLVTVPAPAPDLHCIGVVTGNAGVVEMRHPDGRITPLPPRGWDHFA